MVLRQELEVVNPIAGVKTKKAGMAPRLSSLENMRVALYWNAKSGGDVALTRIGEHLERRFPGVKLELIRSATPGPKESLERAKTFQATIGGTGD
jgi:hypothetical protein